MPKSTYKEKLAKYNKKRSTKRKLKSIDLLISIDPNPKRVEILKRLKMLNKHAYGLMMQPNRTYKEKYHNLQKTTIWKEAKALLIQFSGKRCPLCKGIVQKNPVLHHKKYVVIEIFTPTLIQLVHFGCHKKEHNK